MYTINHVRKPDARFWADKMPVSEVWKVWRICALLKEEYHIVYSKLTHNGYKLLVSVTFHNLQEEMNWKRNHFLLLIFFNAFRLENTVADELKLDSYAPIYINIKNTYIYI
jgi:hypothetical protein